MTPNFIDIEIALPPRLASVNVVHYTRFAKENIILSAYLSVDIICSPDQLDYAQIYKWSHRRFI